MTDEMKVKVQDIIEIKADEAIDQDWIDDTIHLCTFIGWMSEAMNLLGEEGVNDAWKEYDKESALAYYCWLLEMKQAIADWDWDYAHSKVIIKKVEESSEEDF